MAGECIVTDSSSDIPVEILKKYPITIVPMYVGFDGNLKKDLIEIQPEEIYKALDLGKIVHTSSPSAGDYILVFNRLLEKENFKKIYCITLSSELSGAYNAASIAKKSFSEGLIEVIDSKTSTMCLGLIAIQAGEAIKQGLSRKEITGLMQNLIEKNKFIAVLESFEYVFRGGRAAFLGKFIGKAIKFVPILNIGKDGRVKLKKFCSNKGKALKEIYRLTIETAKLNPISIVSIFYGLDSGPAKELERLIRGNNEISVSDIIITKITTVISAHTGPGLWGVAVSPKLI